MNRLYILLCLNYKQKTLVWRTPTRLSLPIKAVTWRHMWRSQDLKNFAESLILIFLIYDLTMHYSKKSITTNFVDICILYNFWSVNICKKVQSKAKNRQKPVFSKIEAGLLQFFRICGLCQVIVHYVCNKYINFYQNP